MVCAWLPPNHTTQNQAIHCVLRAVEVRYCANVLDAALSKQLRETSAAESADRGRSAFETASSNRINGPGFSPPQFLDLEAMETTEPATWLWRPSGARLHVVLQLGRQAYLT